MNPYQTLYIYEIEGKIFHAGKIFQENFLGCWLEAGFSYLFFSEESKERVEEYLRKTPSLSFRSETVMDYRNWEAGKEFEPFRVGKLLVYPFWEEVEKVDGELSIKLDPGLAFGSGNHPTTSKCLEGLVRIYEEDSPRRVLDLGCGSGILSLASVRLGADTVLAVDNNNLAAETSERNCALNGLENKIRVVEGDALQYLDWGADLLIANMSYPVIEQLLNCFHFGKERWYLISGLLRTEVQKIIERLPEFSIRVVRVLSENLWFTILGKKDD